MPIDELQQRGLVADVTNRDELTKLLATQTVSLYAGYDPTSASLHVGSLVPTILLKRFQLAGHRPIVVVGGATGMVGDPSGRSDERNMLDEATLQANVSGIHAQLSRLLDFNNSPNGAVIVNNYDWTRGVTLLEFLRDIGRHLTINYMIAKDSVRNRITREGAEETAGISYTEFSYMLLQAFDFVHLFRSHGCRLQVGGSDQWGNITAGIELGHRMHDAQLFGLVAPLLLDSSGQKMGKTSTGERIWLDPRLTSPYDFYQYWFNRPDEEAPRFLRMFSLASLDEIEGILREHDRDRSQRHAQRAIARAVTSWVHGSEVIVGIEAASRVMFGGTSLKELTQPELDALTNTLPTVEFPRTDLAAGVSFVELLARTKISDSKSKARALITQGGAYVNDVQIKDAERKLTLADLATETMLVVRSGKRNYHLVRVI
jgi:tyrosyl-tRNA synthetase